MNKVKLFFAIVLMFFIFFVLTALLVGSILICINNFIDLEGVVWFWRGVTISAIVSLVSTVLMLHNSKRIVDTKLSFWFKNHSSKLLVGYVFLILALNSIESQLVWTTESVYDILSLQWTIFGLSLTIFLVWDVIIVNFLQKSQPKGYDSNNLIQKYKLVMEKSTFSQDVESTYVSVVILTINLFLLLWSTLRIYISVEPESVFTQNLLRFSFFFTTNSIACLFLNVLKPLKKDKEEMLKNNSVTKEDVDKAQTALFIQAVVDDLEGRVMSLDPEKYTAEDKKKIFIQSIDIIKDSLHDVVDSKSENQQK